jgi:hypothetical protein
VAETNKHKYESLKFNKSAHPWFLPGCERVLVTQTRSPPHPSPVYFGYPNTLIPHSFAAPSLPHPARSCVWVGLLFDFATYAFFLSARHQPVFSSMLSLTIQIPGARLLYNSSHPSVFWLPKYTYLSFICGTTIASSRALICLGVSRRLAL